MLDQLREFSMLSSGSPKFPKLIFLDTNIVQNLQTYWDYVFEGSVSPDIESKLKSRGERFTDDILALLYFMRLGQRYGWPLAVSPNTLLELGATPRQNKRTDLITWGNSWAEYFATHFDDSQEEPKESSYADLRHFTHIQRALLSNMLANLPQEDDRQLIVDALERGCDIFLTMDYKSIWVHREAIEPLGLSVMTPSELIDHIGPWIGLLA